MAKAKSPSSDLPVNDRTIWFSDLSYMPPHLKQEVWAAQVLFFVKKNYRLFVDPAKDIKKREIDLLEIDQSEMKKLFDPVTPEGGGGEAKYVTADMKANPVYLHLMNNMRAEIQRMGKQIEVNFKDKYAKTRKMRDSYRAFYSRQIRSIINEEFCKPMGLPPISESQDPYKWIKNFTDGVKKGKDPKEMSNDLVSKFSDLIKNKIESNEDLMLYNEMIYKGDYEQAMEKGIMFFMFEQNKFDDRHADEIFDTIMHHNKGALEWTTDRITGRPLINHYDLTKLGVSPFKKKDGDDLQYYFIEELMTFADFVRTVGFGLKPEKLKEVFLWNKTQGSYHGLNWLDSFNRPNRIRDNAMIRVGRCSVLTQDYDIFLDDVSAAFPNYDTTGLSWDKYMKNNYEINRQARNYNVWRTFYYIPPTEGKMSEADYAWQANFIFDIQVNQDQFRYGEDGRYCKSPLVIYDNSRMASTTDVLMAYLPKINYCWNAYQNCLVNDVHATILSDELMGAMLSSVDEENAINPGEGNTPTGGNEASAAAEQWRMIRQAGRGFIKMVDKQGKPIIDDRKLIMVYKNDQLERADKFLANIVNLYQQMNLSLGNDPNAQKSHVTNNSLEEAVKKSDNSKWFMQKAYEFLIVGCAERFVCYILMAGEENKKLGFKDRWQEFKDVLGMTDGLLIEGLEDVKPEEIGMTVSYVNNDSKRSFVMQLANQYVAQGKMDEDIIYLLLGTDNWKYAYCLMRMALRKKKKELAAEAQLKHEQAMEEKGMDLKIAQALTAAKGAAKDKNIQTQGEIDARLTQLEDQLKGKTMADTKEQIKNDRIAQDNNKFEQEKRKKTFDALAPEPA